MTKTLLANRRRVLTAIAALAAAPMAVKAQAAELVADSGEDQSAALQQALDSAALAGQALRLPGGVIIAANIDFPGNLIVEGVPGRTELRRAFGDPIGRVGNRSGLVLRDIAFTALPDGTKEAPALLSLESSDDITLERCGFSGASMGLMITDAAVTIRDCHFADLGDAAIHSMNSRGLVIAGNRIEACGNAGIRIWRSETGPDGSIITANRIANIDWLGGGNGQNGNGINIFRADEVIVADNHIADCAFSAIRLNTTNNSQVSGNTCLRSRETAIFSEFTFSGSVIANNIIDSAALGISMTNLDQGGELAVCTGNIVRNILPASPVNPDSSPIGIAAEANAAITSNTIQNVPGIGIVAGYGPFLRNVLIASNVLSGCDVGIGVSVAPDAGPVHIADNMIYQPLDHAVIGMAWDDVVETDLLNNSDRYPNVSIG